MAFAPVTFTRIDANHYIVGQVHLLRTVTEHPEGHWSGRWEAFPHGDRTQRPLFSASSLEEILDMAHGACEMMRPA